MLNLVMDNEFWSLDIPKLPKKNSSQPLLLFGTSVNMIKETTPKISSIYKLEIKIIKSVVRMYPKFK